MEYYTARKRSEIMPLFRKRCFMVQTYPLRQEKTTKLSVEEGINYFKGQKLTSSNQN